MVSRSLVYGLKTPTEALKRTLCIVIRLMEALFGVKTCLRDCGQGVSIVQNVPEVD